MTIPRRLLTSSSQCCEHHHVVRYRSLLLDVVCQSSLLRCIGGQLPEDIIVHQEPGIQLWRIIQAIQKAIETGVRIFGALLLFSGSFGERRNISGELSAWENMPPTPRLPENGNANFEIADRGSASLEGIVSPIPSGLQTRVERTDPDAVNHDIEMNRVHVRTTISAQSVKAENDYR